MDRLDAMAVFLAVAEEGSLSAAARRLDAPLTTISRKISGLEDHLKTQLVTRSSRKISLTDAGKSYVGACKRILEEVVEAERTASGEYLAPKGALHLTAPIVLGRLYLVPVLAEFLSAFPDIDATIALSDRLVDLAAEEVDAALRLGDLADSALIATRVGLAQRVFAASPDYMARRGVPKTPSDLTHHDCVGVQGFLGSSFWSVAGVGAQMRFRVTVNSTDAACDAAKAGLGIISVFSHHVAQGFEDGSLVPVLAHLDRPLLPLSLVRSSADYLPLKLRAFADFAAPRLKARLSADRDGFLATMSRYAAP